MNDKINDWGQKSADQTIELTQYFLTHYKIDSWDGYLDIKMCMLQF